MNLKACYAQTLFYFGFQSPREETARARSASESASAEEEDEEYDNEESAAASLIDPALDEYEAGKYSPIYLTQEDLEPGSIVITEAEDVAKLNVDQVFKVAYSGKLYVNVRNF